MTKQQKRGEELTNLLLEFESTRDPQKQNILLQEIISKGHEYNRDYKRPHMHPFMGKKIKISNVLLDELEKMNQYIQK